MFVRHGDDVSKTSTVPIPLATWKTASNPGGERVSLEIVVNNVHVLPRFILVF